MAFEPIQRSIGLDQVPEPLRSQVLAIQDVRHELVLGYWDELMRMDPDDMQGPSDDVTARITSPYLAVFGRRLAPSERDDLLDRIEHLQIEEWPDSGHCVHLVDVDRFATRLGTFTESCRHNTA